MTPTNGTLFHQSHIPLHVWFKTFQIMSDYNQVMTARKLQRLMHFGSYHTSCNVLSKIRDVMRRINNSKDYILDDIVEFIALPFLYRPLTRSDCPSYGQNTLLLATEYMKDANNILHAQLEENLDQNSIVSFAKLHISPGTRLYTDGWHGYTLLENKGFKLQNVSTYFTKSIDSTPKLKKHFDSIINMLKGFKRKGIKISYLRGCIDEYVFRNNIDIHASHRYVELRSESTSTV